MPEIQNKFHLPICDVITKILGFSYIKQDILMILI